MNTLYTASAVATGDGRNGHTRTFDGLVDTDVRVPKEMGGEGGAPNPELLFAAGYAACFHSALRVVSKQVGVDVTDSEVVADVSIGTRDNGGFGLAVALEINLPHADHDAAERAAQAAYQVCPYSNATRGNVETTLTIA